MKKPAFVLLELLVFVVVVGIFVMPMSVWLMHFSKVHKKVKQQEIAYFIQFSEAETYVSEQIENNTTVPVGHIMVGKWLLYR